MSSSKRQRGAKGIVGNAIALLSLAAISLFFLRITEGAWWFAAPQAERWWTAAAVIALYAAFCGWSLRPKRKPAPKRRVQPAAKPEPQLVAGLAGSCGE